MEAHTTSILKYLLFLAINNQQKLPKTFSSKLHLSMILQKTTRKRCSSVLSLIKHLRSVTCGNIADTRQCGGSKEQDVCSVFVIGIPC